MKIVGAALAATANKNGIEKMITRRFTVKNSDDHYIAASRSVGLTFLWSRVSCHPREIRYIDNRENTITYT